MKFMEETPINKVIKGTYSSELMINLNNFLFSLRNDELINNNYSYENYQKILGDIINQLVNLNEEDRTHFICLINDIINKKIHLFADKSLDAKTLKKNRDILKMFKYSLNLLLNQELIESDYRYHYDIIDILSENPQNFQYIKNIINTIPEFKDARRNDEHIVLKFLDSFGKNYKLKLVDQGLSYINPEFYRDLIDEFNRLQPDYEDEDIESYNTYLEELEKYVLEKNYSDKDSILRDIDYLKKSIKNIQVENIDDVENEINLEIRDLKMRLNQIIEDNEVTKDKENIISSSEVFKISNNDKYAYNIKYSSDGSLILDVHMLNLGLLISNNSLLIDKMKQDINYISNNNLNLPKFKEGKTYPTITYHIHLLNDNKVYLTVEPTITKIVNEYDYHYLVTHNQLNLNIMNNILSRILEDVNTYDLDYVTTSVDQIISDLLKPMLENSSMIYRSELDLKDLINKNHNAICDKLYKIAKPDAHKIFDILEKDDYKIYTDTCNEDSMIVIDPYNYLGLNLQKIIMNKYNNRITPNDNMTSILKELNKNNYFVNVGKKNKRLKR
ncbi:MAG: hypothetical protein IJ574_02980 [Bacilli bacterium]|nr:hypothetical protein [Bacilli bacterium]